MKKLIFVAIMLFVASPACAGEFMDNARAHGWFSWDKKNTELHVVFSLLMLAGTSQTVYIAENPDEWKETGIARHFIGEHPSKEDVYIFEAAAVTLTTLATWVLPPHIYIGKYKIPLSYTVQLGGIAVEGYSVYHNVMVGVGWSY